MTWKYWVNFQGKKTICNQPRSNYVYVHSGSSCRKIWFQWAEQTKIEFQFAVLHRIFIYHQLSTDEPFSPKTFHHITKLLLFSPWRFSLVIFIFSFFIALFFVPLAINTASIPDSISRSISFYEPIFFPWSRIQFFPSCTSVWLWNFAESPVFIAVVSFHCPDEMVFKNHDVEIVYIHILYESNFVSANGTSCQWN